MKKQEYKEINLVIESIGFEGISIARNEGLVYIVKGGIPGEKVLAIEKKRKRRYIEATVKEVIEPSVHRVKPVCKHFGVCGGCSWQNLDYDQQLFWKKKHVLDSFEHIGKIEIDEVADTLPSPMQYFYRNKMEFSFGCSRWLTEDEIESGQEIDNKTFALGLHVPGRYDKVLDIDECHLVDSSAIDILSDLRSKALEMDIMPYYDKTQKGFLKNLIFRNISSGSKMVILVTNEFENENELKFIDWMFKELKNKFRVDSIVHAVNPTVSPVAIGEIRRIEGDEYLIEVINGIKFKISPFSFFQTNTKQLPRFMKSIIEMAEINKNDIVWDLFCGTGAISLHASSKARSVFGFEYSEHCVNDAKENSILNSISNTTFVSADLNAKNINELLSNYPKCDLMLIDHPRAGLHKNLVDSIIKILPEKIVYVSCNPASQARDCNLLSQEYSIKKIQPIDMFPQTYHIESIALLMKKR